MAKENSVCGYASSAAGDRCGYWTSKCDCGDPWGTTGNSHSGRNLLQSSPITFWGFHRKNCSGAYIAGIDGSHSSAVERKRCSKWTPRSGYRFFQKKWRCMGGSGATVHRPPTYADRERCGRLAGGNQSLSADCSDDSQATGRLERDKIVGC